MNAISKPTRRTLPFSGIFIAVLAIFVAACSGGSDGPSESQIKNAYTLRLPSGVEVDDIDVQVSENEGTKVEPLYKTRSKVTLRASENFYEVTGHVLDKDVVKQTFAEGDRVSGTLITSATLRGDSWKIAFTRIDVPSITGVAESKFRPHGFVIDGSDDYKALVKKQADEAKKKAADEARHKAENIAALRKAVAGSWAARYPIFHNGSMWSSNDGTKIGFQLTIPDNGDSVGQGIGAIYNMESPWDQVTAPIGYTYDPGGQYVTLNFTKRMRLGGFRTGPNTRWKLSTDGKLTAQGYNNVWTVQLERNGPALAKHKAAIAAYEKEQNARRDLAVKYNAANATGSFSSLPLSRPHWGTASGVFLVVGRDSGKVWGDQVYKCSSDVATSAVHAGLLKTGQAGVIKIVYTSRNQFKVGGWAFKGTSRNGVVSQASSGWDGCTMKLVKALPKP